ncbi:hypothetical protein BDV3_002714 [Batrachochytrium dendrobatidis]
MDNPYISKDSSTQNALNLKWTFGFNRECIGAVHNLSDSKQKVLFYASAHTGVLYDWVHGNQKLLQGHCNSITSTAVSLKQQWIVTADCGPNSMIIVWDINPELKSNISDTTDAPVTPRNTLQAVPIKNIFDPHDGLGVLSVEFTPDSKYLITLGASQDQTICIWDWTCSTNEPLLSYKIVGELQTCLRVNPVDPFELISNGPNSINFYIWDKESLEMTQNVPVLSSKDFKHTPSGYSYSNFLPSLNQAVSGTKDGEVIVWSDKSLDNLSIKLKKGHKEVVKFIKLHNSPINFITSFQDKFIITGGEDGYIKIFDLNFRILFWYEKLDAGPISSVAISTTFEPMFEDIGIPELVVATKHARILLLHNPQTKAAFSNTNSKTITECALTNTHFLTTGLSSGDNPPTQHQRGTFEFNEVPRITNLLHGQYGNIRGLDAHPASSCFAVGSDSGHLHIWDYDTKKIIISRYFKDIPSTTEAVIAAQKHKKQKADTLIDANDQPGVKSHSVEPTPMVISCLTYSCNGKTLAIGFTNGVLRMLDAQTLQDIPQSYLIKNQFYGYQISSEPITKLSFSPDDDYCAAADAAHVVCILCKEAVSAKSTRSAEATGTEPKCVGNEPQQKTLAAVGEDGNTKSLLRHRVEWVFIGRRKTHFKDIVSLLFLPKETSDSGPRLLSVSKDRHVADFDLAKSNIVGGIFINSIRRIEQIHRPEAAVIYKRHHSIHPENLILTFNSGYKLKQYTESTQLCKKTVLGPTFGGHINNMCLIPSDSETKYLAFSTSNQVIGITVFPLDGNPSTTMGVISHPGEVSNIVCSHDGVSIITAGGTDGIVNCWNINTAVLEAQASIFAGSLEPYLNMLDPSGLGEKSPIYREFEDYFYYAQLQSQKGDAAGNRIISDQVSLTQVPSIVQAMGYYPSNQEIDDMINEVKYSRFSQGEGKEVESITFPELIKLYLNHRPVRDISLNDIEIALSHAKRLEPGKPLPKGPVVKLSLNQTVSSKGIVSLLQQFGESFSLEDVHEAFSMLLMDHPIYRGQLPHTINAKDFIQDVLGLVPTEPTEIELGGDVDKNTFSSPPTHV